MWPIACGGKHRQHMEDFVFLTAKELSARGWNLSALPFSKEEIIFQTSMFFCLFTIPFSGGWDEEVQQIDA